MVAIDADIAAMHRSRMICKIPTRTIVAVVLMTMAFMVPSAALAQFFVGPAASGAGGGGRAAIDPGESPFLNPASVAFMQKYNVSTYFAQSSHVKDGEQSAWGVALADGTAGNIVSGAFSYVRKRTDFSGGLSRTQQDMQISLSGFPLRKVALGLAGHRLIDQELSAFSGSEHTQYNGHIGLIYVPASWVGIGFVAYDAFRGSDDVPEHLRLTPTQAVAINFVQEKQFRLRLDFVRPDMRNPERKVDVNAGLETQLQEMLVFRVGGYWKETAGQTFFTTGLAFQGPRLSVEYGFQKDVRDADNGRHLIDLWITL